MSETISTAIPPLLQVQDLHVAFGGKPVVQGVSFALHAGEKLALVGESGSGKSVSMLAVMGLLPDTATITADEMTFEGQDLLPQGLLGPFGHQLVFHRQDLDLIFQPPHHPLLR